jgi:hypothetical protein
VTSGFEDLSQPYSGSEKSTPCLGLARRTSSSSLRLALTSWRSSCLSSSSIILSASPSFASSTGLGPIERTALYCNYFYTIDVEPVLQMLQCGSGSSIQGQRGSGSVSRVLMTKNQTLQFTYPWASIKDVQATKEAFSPQKRTFSTLKHEITATFPSFWDHFCLPGSGFGSACPIRIRIHPTKIHADRNFVISRPF